MPKRSAHWLSARGIRTSPPVLLSVIWPRHEASGEPTLETTRQRLGGTSVEVEHDSGYLCARTRTASEDPLTDTLTYAVVHPTTGRLLVVRVTAFEDRLDDLDVGDYDFTIGQLTWDES